MVWERVPGLFGASSLSSLWAGTQRFGEVNWSPQVQTVCRARILSKSPNHKNYTEVEQNLSSGIFLCRTIIPCVFFYFFSNIFHIFHNDLALLWKLSKTITFSLTKKRGLFTLTSKHGWEKKEKKKFKPVTEENTGHSKSKEGCWRQRSYREVVLRLLFSLPAQHLGTINGCWPLLFPS